MGGSVMMSWMDDCYCGGPPPLLKRAPPSPSCLGYGGTFQPIFVYKSRNDVFNWDAAAAASHRDVPKLMCGLGGRGSEHAPSN
jgi:hypothetical protein